MHRQSGKFAVPSLSNAASPLRFDFNATVQLYLVYIGKARFAGISRTGDGMHFAYLKTKPADSNLSSYWYCSSLEDARAKLEESYKQQRNEPVWLDDLR